MIDGASSDSTTPLCRLSISDEADRQLGISAETIERWCRWFVILAIVARSIRFLVRYPLWEDECFLCSSLIDRDFLGLTRQLDYPPQIAPILYLWSQLAVVRTFGFNEWSLRLTAFIVSILSVWLFARLAKVFLSGLPRLFAVAIFCVSYVGIRYAAEAKPYGLDLFVSLAMISLAVEWLRSGGRTSRLAFLILLTPAMLGFSFPAVFVAGGLSMAIALCLRRQASARLWSGWAIFSFFVVASFGVAYLLSIRQRMDTDLSSMQGYWADAFPPIERPWLLPLWLLRVHASDMTAYPVGGPMFASSASLLLWIAGIVYLVRARQWTLLVFAIAPLSLTFIAAAVQKYPYGGHFKFSLFLAPWICMVLGCGLASVAPSICRRLAWTGQTSPKIVRGMLAVLAAIAVLTSIRDIAWPYKSIGDLQDRAFAQWFWNQQERRAEVACTKCDLGLDPSPSTYAHLSYSAVFRCNLMIYSDRHRERRPIAWDQITTSHPLICAMYRDPWEPFDHQTLDRWLQEMSTRYELTNRAVLPMSRKDHLDRKLVIDSYVETFRFVPIAKP